MDFDQLSIDDWSTISGKFSRHPSGKMLRLGVLALAAYAASALPPAPVPEEQYREPDLNSAPSGTPATKEYDTKYAWGDSKDYTPGPKPACCDDNSCRDSTSWYALPASTDDRRIQRRSFDRSSINKRAGSTRSRSIRASPTSPRRRPTTAKKQSTLMSPWSRRRSRVPSRATSAATKSSRFDTK